MGAFPQSRRISRRKGVEHPGQDILQLFFVREGGGFAFPVKNNSSPFMTSPLQRMRLLLIVFSSSLIFPANRTRPFLKYGRIDMRDFGAQLAVVDGGRNIPLAL